MTVAERKLWAELRKHRLPIRRQAPIGVYIVDFACHSAKLVVEVDGVIHNLPEVAVRDLGKSDWLERRDYRVLRFSNDQVLANPENVAAKIAAAVRAPPSQPFAREGGRAF